MIKENEKEKIEFRYYEIPRNGVPLIALLGERWETVYGEDPMHFHNYLEVGYCYRGKGKMNLAGKEVPYQPGTITVIPPNFPHHTVTEKLDKQKWEYLFVDSVGFLKENFTGRISVVDDVIRRLHDRMIVLHPGEDEEIDFLVKMLLNDMRKKTEFYQESIKSILMALLLRLIRMNPMSEVKDIRIENGRGLMDILKVLEYIEQHYQEEIHIADLQRVSHMSESHFRRKFQEYMNTSPTEYVNLIRIKKACELLKQSEDSVETIALRAGFQTTGAFIRNFKKLVGKVPHEWRKQARGASDALPNYQVSVLKGW